MDIWSKWDAPEFVRCDNGTELVNHLTSALYDAFGVRVLRGTVRHPQSQGAVERFNRTLLTLIRKTESQCDDWLSALNMMLFASICYGCFTNGSNVWLVTTWSCC